MSDLKIREEKIKAERRQTSWRDFVKEIGSWSTLLFYKQNNLISKHPPVGRIQQLISYDAFSAQRESFTNHGHDYVPNVPFFEQFKKLFDTLPFPTMLRYGQNENVDFANEVLNSKNVYLSSTVIVDCENVLYSINVKEASSHVYNSVMVWNTCEQIYFGTGILESSMVFYSKYIKGSYTIRFCQNLVGCQECLFCTDLENKSYCIHNKQYTKEEYLQEKNRILQEKNKFLTWYKELNQPGKNYGSTAVEGTFVSESEHVENGLFDYQLKSCRNAVLRGGKGVNENMVDVISGGTVGNDSFYAVHGAGAGADNLYCCCHITTSSHMYYCYNLKNCSYCLGCIGLKNKSFCIFNKQYEKDERFAKATEILQKMDADGILGQFFPGRMNPFYFNDTAAYLLDDSFTKEEVTKGGYLRRDTEVKVDIPENVEIVFTNPSPTLPLFPIESGLLTVAGKGEHPAKGVGGLWNYQSFDPSGSRTIDPAIMQKVIVDEKGNSYKIVPMEYAFLMKHGLPLPEIHWLERIKLGFRFK